MRWWWGVAISAWPMLAYSAPPPVCKGRVAPNYDSAHDEEASPRAVGEVMAAYQALCPTNDCGTGKIVRNPTVGDNAVTWIIGKAKGKDARAKIVYSASFMDAIAQRFGPGASFGVLAHEVGHHLTNALALRKEMDSSWDEELRADFLAGCALARAGKTPEEMANALRALASVATTSHPSFAHRVPVVEKGYHSCEQATAEVAAAVPFGLGGELRRAKLVKDEGCWSYRYRLVQEQLRLGPIAPPRRQSRGYPNKKECERARQARTQDREGETCQCVE